MRNPDWDFLKSFVDDITQANKAKKGKQAMLVDETVEMADNLIKELVGSGCQISDKSTLIGGDKNSRKAVQKKLKAKGIDLAPSTYSKYLPGVSHSL